MNDATKQEDVLILLTDVRLAFPALWVPEQVGGKGKPAFSGNFLMAPVHPSLILVRDGIKKVALAKWGAQARDVLTQLVAADRVCLHNGDAKANYDGFAGKRFVSARGYVKPLVINQAREELGPADGKPYSGCFVNAQISIWAQQNQHGKRVNAQLSGVQFLRDGPAFGGGHVSQVDEFDIIAEGVDDVAPVTATAAGFDDFSDII